jgi:hypothetical protein
MTAPIFDVTAGRRARELRDNPDAPRPITDPTDPRNGLAARGRQDDERPAQRDPTDPHAA